MRKLTKKVSGLLFLAASSVYSGQRLWAAPATPAGGTSGAKGDPTVVPVDSGATTTKIETVDPGGAPMISSAAGQTFNLTVADNTDIVKVLRILSETSQKNIIASKDVRGSVTANLHNVTVKEALDAILKANGFVYREKGNFIYVYTAKELAEIEKAERVMETRTFRVSYTPVANAAAMIKPFLSTEAQVSFSAAPKIGIESSQTVAGGQDNAAGDLLVIRDYQDNLKRVAEAMKEIDARPQQILVEATILRASMTDDNALGIDFTAFGGVDFAGITTAGATAADALSGKILDNKDAGRITDSGYAGGGTGFTSGTKGTPTGGLRVGVVKNNIAVFLSALEEVSNTTVLANPKILALNKQKGEVIVGKKTGYLTTTVTDTTAVQSVEFLETGTRLIFRPFVGADGFIRMEVHPEDSDGGLVNNLPVKTTTEITSNVMVRDGHTIVIGGLFREVSDTGRGQVPGLGNAPIVGPLFRRQRDRVEREEIIILLTPHVIKDEKAYAEASEATLKDAEKLRVGVRQGMMPFGRERLAETAYDKATEEMAKPQPDQKKALWYLDCATNLNPTFLEAIKMKQRLTGVEISTVDNSTIRDFVKRQILAERSAAPAAPEPKGPSSSIDLRVEGLAGKVTTRPATQPALAVAQEQLECPGCPDASDEMAKGPATQPSTRPVVEAATTSPLAAAAATQPASASSDANLNRKPLLENPESEVVELPAPTTRPAEGSAVTELPVGDVTEIPGDLKK